MLGKVTPEERAETASAVIHALDLRAPARKKDDERPVLVRTDTTSLLAALDDVRPIASAPSVGDVVRSLSTATSTRARRRALAELGALVNRAAHGRTKRGERANLLAQLVLLLELHAALGLRSDLDLRSTRRSIEQLG